jgi:nucleoside-diphosphate-sugar epimerase
MTILLTGATGFIGSHLLKRFVSDNHKLIILKQRSSNITRIEKYLKSIKYYDRESINLESLFKENSIDMVVHSASSFSKNRMEIVNFNLKFSLDLFYLSMDYNSKFINLDSTSHYYRNNLYSQSKKIFRDILMTLGFSNILNLPIELVYGENENRERFLPIQIHKLIDNVPIDMTEGFQKRNIIHIDDLVDAISFIVKEINLIMESHREIFLASDDNIQIKDLILTLKKMTNSSSIINFGAISYVEKEKNSTIVNNHSLKKIGWKPKINLEEGLVKKIEEIRRNYV